jgi:hypothetical protein
MNPLPGEVPGDRPSSRWIGYLQQPIDATVVIEQECTFLVVVLFPWPVTWLLVVQLPQP